MASAHAPTALQHVRARLGQLWQLPLLLVSFALFGYAAWLFIDPKPGLSIDQKIDIARLRLKQQRPDAAAEQLNKILTSEKLDREHEAQVHLLLSQSIENFQKLHHENKKSYHEQIIEQTGQALALGMKPDADIHRRLGESYEALHRPAVALEHYRQSMAMDPGMAVLLQRKVIDLQLASKDPGPAAASIDQYLKTKDLTDTERAWALGEQAQLLMSRGDYVTARKLLADALKLDPEPESQGPVNYRLGVCAWKLGDIAEAERLLRVSRDQMKSQNPLDADAAMALAKIYDEKDDARTAQSFYQDVLVSHPDSRLAPLALLGRGVDRVRQGEDEAGLSDLHDLTNQVAGKSSFAEEYKTETITGLHSAASVLVSRSNYQGALELMVYEQSLEPAPAPEFFARLGQVYEQRADQLEKLAEADSAADKIRRAKQVRDLRTQAGDAYVAYSRGLTLTDDKGYGEALWKGIDLYDRAGNVQCVMSALELFVAERPDDSLAPVALLRLGKAYRTAGIFDKAIAAYQRNQFRYPQSLAASKSAVPLAQAYIAKGPENYTKAEAVLKSVVENNPLLTPEAEEFRQALFELAQLYYRTGRFEDAVGRLEESVQRYPNDDRMGQLLFLMADSYRKSATLLDARLASADPAGAAGTAADMAEAAAAKKERLGKARGLFDQVIQRFQAVPAKNDTDKLYNKLSHFYRADCVYDQGQFDEAIRLYDAAAFRYQDDASALAAYVQIVNAYCALGKIDEAKTANERAKWMLRRMPESSFTDGTFAMPRQYWQQWLQWTSASGMW